MKRLFLLLPLLLCCLLSHAQPEVIVPPKPKPTTGTLKITSTPSDVAVKVDGEYVGNTPLTLKNRKAGTYQVSFNAEGYVTQTKSVSITAGKTATCSATLKKKQVAQATTTVTSTTSSDGSSQTITANGVSFKMIHVEGGTFTMGATSEQGSDADDNEKPTHRVTLSGYYIGETEVTQALWEAVMGSNPSHFKGDNRPVEEVSWDDCQTFIRKLNSLTGRSFRLPTEAEWEFAARGGNKSQGYKYSGSNTLGNVAWYYDNSGYETHPVRMKSANELGIYDMSGNVWEWCEDLYDSSGSSRVCRGGGLHYGARSCRVSGRDYYTPDRRDFGLGLRLAL